MKTAKWAVIMVLGTMLSIGIAPAPGLASSILGSAQDFAVLGASTVTNAGSSTIYGSLGVDPTNSIVGFPLGTVTGGSIYGSGGVSNLGQSAALTAYNTLAGLSVTTNLTGQDLGGLTLTPGVYKFNSSAQLTGVLNLDFLGNPNANFIFQIGDTLTTASSSSVNVVNGNSTSGVYWQVGSSATLGTSTMFAGNILANQSITLNNKADILSGRAIALNAAVTMDANRISNNGTLQNFGSYGFSGGSVTPVPLPSTILLFGPALVGLGMLRRRFTK